MQDLKINIAIYVLDDDKEVTDLIDDILKSNAQVDYKLFNNIDEFIDALNDNFHICVIDYLLNDAKTALDVINIIKERKINCYTIVMSMSESIQTIINLLNAGVNKYLRKLDKDFETELISCVKEGVNFIHENIEFYKEIIGHLNSTKTALREIRQKSSSAAEPALLN